MRCAGRSAAFSGALAVLAVLVTAATDEGGVAWGERLARVLPLVPVTVAIAVAVTLAGPRRQVETFALEALGRSPFANACGSIVGAGLVGVGIGLVLLVDPRLPFHAFFPTVQGAGPYSFEAGRFTNARTGWGVSADGTIALEAPAGMALEAFGGGSPAHGRLAAALVIMLGSVGFALTAAALRPGGRTRSPRRGAAAALVLTAAATTVCLQASASGRLPALVAALPPTLLFLGAAWAILRGRWEPTTK